MSTEHTSQAKTTETDIQVGSVTVCSTDLETLEPLKYVNDTVIMAYGSIVAVESKEELYKDSARKVLLLDTRFATKVALKRGYKMLAVVPQFQKALKSALENRGIIFLPIHVKGNHWTCIICDLRSGSMSYLDSLGPANEYVAYLLFKKIWKLLDLTCSLVPIQGLPEHWTVGIPTSPQQQNGYDCGLYVCAAMRAVMLGIPFKVSPGRMSSFRRGIRKSLQGWSHSAPEPNNLELLQANEVFTALIIPGTLLSRWKKTKGGQQATEVMDLD